MEEDYMSDVFLSQSAQVKPGLLTKSQKRKINDGGKGRPQAKKKKVVEDEKRKLGLATPLSLENKGFALLQKMGYKQGAGIGKSGAGETNLIPLVLKDGRGGLGRSSFLKEKEAVKTAQKHEQQTQTLTDFIQRKQQSQIVMRMEGDFRHSQQACEQLDKELGQSIPTIPWFWASPSPPAEDKDSDESSDCEEEPLVAEKLATLTDYLRDNHFYCVWCGTSYESTKDMSMHCPGNTREVHDNF